MDLTGSWRYKTDPTNTENPQTLEPSDDWDEMEIPNNWYLEGLEYSGTVWFYRDFEYTPGSDRQILQFDGVDYFASVWLNGEKVGEHEGYFQPFEFDVTEQLQEGHNGLLVKVRSPKEDPEEAWPAKKFLIKGIFNHHDARPGSWNPERGQEKNTGGIWNEVTLEEKPGCRITDLRVAPRLMEDGSALVRAKIELENQGNACRADLQLDVEPKNFEGPDVTAQFTEQLSRGSNTVEETFVLEDPKLWWTWDHGDQNLYDCEATLEVPAGSDYRRDYFGVREIDMEGKDANSVWKLNGKRFFPRGSNIIPTQWLAEYNEEMIEGDVELMKEANLNVIRVHAHVNREEFYEACDRAGIMVWQDFALQWSYEETNQFYNNAQSQARDMVEHLYNHPSITIWCCHNEPSVNEGTLDNLLFDVVREEDPVRHVEHHSDFRDHPYPGGHRHVYTKFAALPGAPFVNEFGAQALPSADHVREMFDDPEDAWPPDWEEYAFHDFQYDQTFNVAEVDLGDSLEEFVENSQSYQYNLLKYAIERYRRNRYNPMVGVIQFMFVECWPSITWAVLDYQRTQKEGYEALKLGMQPVLPSFDVPRHELQLEERSFALFNDLTVVNDLHRSFPDAEVEIWFEDPSGNRVLEENLEAEIPADGTVTPVQTEMREDYWLLPGDIEPGDCYLKVRIKADGETIANNKEKLKVLPAGGSSLRVEI